MSRPFKQTINHYFILIVVMAFQFSILGQVNGIYYFNQNNAVEVTKGSTNLRNPWTGGMNSSQISKIDLNNDGTEDLFVFDRTGNTIITYLWNDTDQKWDFAPEYASQFPDLQYWAILRDYNCDGKKDIFSYVSGGVGVWKNTSTGTQLSFEYVSDPYVQATLLGGTVANLYVSKVDIPDINDIDGDGDLDVLTFGIIGSRLEYYQNMSQEMGYGCDSIIYQIANTCWGHFLEDGSNTNSCALKDTCGPSENVNNPKSSRHTGSTVLTLDLNDDGVKDLLLGDVSFNNIVALYNDSKGVNMNTSMLSQDTAFPSSSLPVNLQLFPASFYEDIDNDGKKDLIFSPNTDNATENHNSLWLYKNYGTNTLPVLAHIQNNFLQDETIDVGTNAYPVLFDYNNDGLLDLFIGNFGYYSNTSGTLFKGKIALYENVGTSLNPQFNWITDDFANVSSAGIGSGVYPTFGDIDNDGDVDMIIGDHNGRLHLYLNSSGNLTNMNLSLSLSQMTDDNSTIIDIGYSAKPFLFDLDQDGDLDLIIGEENGVLNHYENTGTTTNYSFRLQSSNFGGINVSDWWTTVGNSAPWIIRNSDDELELFVGSHNGMVHHYNNIDGNLSGTFTEVTPSISYLPKTSNSCVALGHLNGDTLIDLIVGNERGGVSYFSGSDDISLNVDLPTAFDDFTIYPNPTNGIIQFKGITPEQVTLYGMNGQLILKASNTNSLNLGHLEKGVYLIEITKGNDIFRSKVIRQ